VCEKLTGILKVGNSFMQSEFPLHLRAAVLVGKQNRWTALHRGKTKVQDVVGELINRATLGIVGIRIFSPHNYDLHGESYYLLFFITI
jgi:hypothetical protein